MKVSGNSDFKSPEPGSYRAVCTRLIDLGTQESSYAGETKTQHKVMLCWEIEQLMDDGRPFLVSQRYTVSIHPKSTLGQHLASWRGVEFTEEERDGWDLAKILGKSCLLNLVKEGKYTNIKGVMKLPNGMQPLERQGELVHFSFDDFSMDTFSKLSERVQETIKKSPEWSRVSGEKGVQGGDEQIPF